MGGAARKVQPSCKWCKCSQTRHEALHCGRDAVNLETSSETVKEIAAGCIYYEFDAAKNALRKFL